MIYGKKILSPLGNLFLVANDNALLLLDNTSNPDFQNSIKLNEHYILNLAHKQLDEYFNGLRTQFDLPLAPKGSAFQQTVWRALLEIPFGKVWSYGQQANFINSPKASRAVGGANGKNPLPIIIPCHRVIGTSGKLTGYSAGINMKINLLKHEGHLIDGLQLLQNI